MITDGTSDPLGLHRPGWRIPSGGSEQDVFIRDSQRELIEQARAEYLDHLTNAWKGNFDYNPIWASIGGDLSFHGAAAS